MKKLIKNEICGSMNSAQMHCSLEKVNICGYCSCNSAWTVTALHQKRVKKKKKNAKRRRWNADVLSKLSLNVHHSSVVWNSILICLVWCSWMSVILYRGLILWLVEYAYPHVPEVCPFFSKEFTTFL